MSGRYTPTLKNYQLKLVGFGWAGSGKTHLLYSFNSAPQSGPLLALNCRGNPDEFLLHKDNGVVVWNITSSSGIDMPLDFLIRGQPKNHPFRREADIPQDMMFKSVGLDTLTDWQLLKAMELLRGQKNRGNDDPLLVEEIMKHLSDAPATKPAFWGDLQNSTLAVAGALISLPIHVVIMLQKHVKVDFTGGSDSQEVPWLLGSSRDALPGWIPLVGSLVNQYPVGSEVGKVKWWDGNPVAQNEAAPYIRWSRRQVDDLTKNQVTPALGKGMWTPSAEKILSIVEKELLTKAA